MKILNAGVYAVVAKVNIALADTGLTSINCAIIYQTEGQYKSWEPGRDLNAFNTFEVGKGYIIYVKSTVDLSDDLVDVVNDIGASDLIIANQFALDATLQFLDNGLGAPIGDPITINANTILTIAKADVPAGSGTFQLFIATTQNLIGEATEIFFGEGYAINKTTPEFYPNGFTSTSDISTLASGSYFVMINPSEGKLTVANNFNADGTLSFYDETAVHITGTDIDLPGQTATVIDQNSIPANAVTAQIAIASGGGFPTKYADIATVYNTGSNEQMNFEDKVDISSGYSIPFSIPNVQNGNIFVSLNSSGRNNYAVFINQSGANLHVAGSSGGDTTTLSDGQSRSYGLDTNFGSGQTISASPSTPAAIKGQVIKFGANELVASSSKFELGSGVPYVINYNDVLEGNVIFIAYPESGSWT